MKHTIKYGIVILAAGGSTRLGSPKQLKVLPNGKTLLRNIVDEALTLPSTCTLVVTGAKQTEVEQEIQESAAQICYNEQWHSGMASSIQKGIAEIKRWQPQVEACILTVCDQPFLNAMVLAALIERHEQTGKGIVASGYADAIGTPALFIRNYFDELVNLDGDEGAKKLIKKYTSDVSIVPFPKGEIDIDRPGDLT